MLNIDDNGLFEIFPMIETISESFEYQNSMLNKIVLTGKINALEIAENLFNFTEQTAQTFAELQSKLIEHLLKENQKELYSKAKIKAQMTSNLLMKNLELRGNDIYCLSEDVLIKNYLDTKENKEAILKYLTDYQSQNTIYNEILLLDVNGKILVNINKKNRAKYSKDDIIKKAMQSDGFIQEYKRTDLFISQKESLFFIKKVQQDEKIVGFIVLFYDIKQEMQELYKEIINQKETIVVVDSKNNILSASEKGLDKNFIKRINKLDTFMIINNKFYVKVKISSKKGINDLYVIVSYPKRDDINIIAEFSNENTNNRELVNINLNNPELKQLADDGYEILEDLSDVIINGELIAAKSKQYILIPILDNLREVSFKVVKLIELSISNLQKIINESLDNNVKLISEMFIKLIVRNLYEISNNVRLWAKNDTIIEALASKDYSTIKSELQFLNNVYDMYSDIFVYDKEGKIVAISNSEHFTGDVIDRNYTSSNIDSNRYFITHFENTKLYGNKPTYIFYASIVKDNQVIGGIGVVFDALKEFSNMLKLSFDSENGIGILVDSHKKIISSNIDDFKIFDEFNLIDNDNFKDGYIGEVEFNNKIYKIGITQSKNYREFESNDLYSIIMMEK